MILNFHRNQCKKVIAELDEEERKRKRQKRTMQYTIDSDIEDEEQWKIEYRERIQRFQIVNLGAMQKVDVLNLVMYEIDDEYNIRERRIFFDQTSGGRSAQ